MFANFAGVCYNIFHYIIAIDKNIRKPYVQFFSVTKYFFIPCYMSPKKGVYSIACPGFRKAKGD